MNRVHNGLLVSTHLQSVRQPLLSTCDSSPSQFAPGEFAFPPPKYVQETCVEPALSTLEGQSQDGADGGFSSSGVEVNVGPSHDEGSFLELSSNTDVLGSLSPGPPRFRLSAGSGRDRVKQELFPPSGVPPLVLPAGPSAASAAAPAAAATAAAPGAARAKRPQQLRVRPNRPQQLQPKVIIIVLLTSTFLVQ